VIDVFTSCSEENGEERMGERIGEQRETCTFSSTALINACSKSHTTVVG